MENLTTLVRKTTLMGKVSVPDTFSVKAVRKAVKGLSGRIVNIDKVYF
jgi:hypothetical protein